MESLDLNPVVISAISSLTMAGIWIIYLQIAIRQYKRANRPFLVIHHAHENDPEALCLIVNMSREPVHISCVLVNIFTADGRERCYITDYKRLAADDDMVLEKLRQGPIDSGGYLILGSFRDIALRPNTEAGENGDEAMSLAEVSSFEICVAAVHGASKYHVGARRRFFVEREEERWIIRAYNIHTEQLVTWRKQKAVREWVEGHLEPRHTGQLESRTTQQDNGEHGEGE